MLAAIAQISFGVRNYVLPFFKDIHILAEAYEALDSISAFIGHVAPTGIYISWNYYVKGFANYAGSVSVAFHEMVHALHQENFIKENGVDWDFRKDFEELPTVFGLMLTQPVVQQRSYLRAMPLAISM